eukprot:TRINITY_DN1138_c0_g1_i4.p1 TRINITY_DN1138_c0_g1~~TRINITY_DN1138_c0_g1_i4.p1  ORF type:complete len:317 (-),score=5.77 TRINITY_DN1138_c0_g1_i4:611-1561(-)
MNSLYQILQMTPMVILLTLRLQVCFFPQATFEIFNGDTFEYQNWPYMMTIQTKSDPGVECYSHSCGGVAIAPDVVVTAAHCAWIGNWLSFGQFEGVPLRDLYATKQPPCRHMKGEEGRRQVEFIILASEWNVSFLVGDVALLFLDGEFSGPFVKYQNQPFLEPGILMDTAGYGVISRADNSQFSAIILPPFQAQMTSIPRTQCVELMQDYGVSNVDQVLNYDQMICGFNRRTDTCSGDSGGPLVVRGDTRRRDILVGIASWGPRLQCSRTDDDQAPSVFARISFYANWTKKTIRQRRRTKLQQASAIGGTNNATQN